MEAIIIVALNVLLFVSFWVIGKNKRQHIDDVTEFTKEKYDLENAVKSLQLQIDEKDGKINFMNMRVENAENAEKEQRTANVQRMKRIETVLGKYDKPNAVGATKKICDILKGDVIVKPNNGPKQPSKYPNHKPIG